MNKYTVHQHPTSPDMVVIESETGETYTSLFHPATRRTPLLMFIGKIDQGTVEPTDKPLATDVMQTLFVVKVNDD
jgi:hypothetical protein